MHSTLLTLRALPLILIAACASDVQTQYTLCGDLNVPGDADALRLTLLDESLEIIGSALTVLGESSFGALRADLTLRTESSGRFARVQTLSEGIETLRFTQELTPNGDLLNAVLDRRCLGLTCPVGQTCMEGNCAIIAGNEGRPCGD